MLALITWIFRGSIKSGPRMGMGGWGTGTKYGRMYNTQTVETVSGEVVKVEKIKPMKGMSYGIHILLKTEKGEIPVHLGPAWYINNQDLEIAAGDKVEVKVLMAHEMETGQRKDAQGSVVPAWFIQTVTATHNGKPVLSAQWGTAVAKNPFLSFKFKGGAKGDKVQVTHDEWTITLDTFAVSTGKTTVVYTRLRAPYINPDHFRFTIYRRGFFSDIAKWIGMQDIEVGHEDFDRDFIIKGTEEGKLRALFDFAQLPYVWLPADGGRLQNYRTLWRINQATRRRTAVPLPRIPAENRCRRVTLGRLSTSARAPEACDRSFRWDCGASFPA